MKPVLATLRKRGYLNVGYINDIYVQGDTYEECLNYINDTVAILSRLGFITTLRNPLGNQFKEFNF